MVGATQTSGEELESTLPPHLAFVGGGDAPDPAELTRSFHLNLAAMGLLAFVVGVFLTYNAIAFSYTDRRELIRKIRLAGVARRELARALVAELVLFLLAGSRNYPAINPSPKDKPLNCRNSLYEAATIDGAGTIRLRLAFPTREGSPC